MAILGIVYSIIFVSELPDKTMFALLALATRGRVGAVWAGAAAAFAVHVGIAVTIGGILVTLLPYRAVQALAAVLFLAGAAWVLRGSAQEAATGPEAGRPPSTRRTFLTTFSVIFVAEWGDLTQILTANMAAHYHAPLAVGLGAGLALWSVAALAVTASRPLARLPTALVRRAMSLILLGLAGVTAVEAITGHAGLL